MATTATPTITELLLEEIGSTGNVRTGPVDQGEDFDALAGSVRERGVLAPVLVAPHDGETPYVLVDGHRRLAAAAAAGLERIPARVVEISDRTDGEVLAMVANVRRLNLGPVEEADAYVRILDANGWTQRRLADSLGVSEGHVSSRLKLSRLPQGARDQISAGAVPLAAVPTIEKVAMGAPELAGALVSEDSVARYGAPATEAAAAETLRDLGWARGVRVYGREEDPPPPFVYELTSRGSGYQLRDFGLLEGDHPDLAARFTAAQAGDQYDYIHLVGTFEDLCDQARAYGCLLELDGRCFITDETWMADRLTEAIAAHKPRKAAAAAQAPETAQDEKEAKAWEREKERVERLAAGARNRDLERTLRVSLMRPERIDVETARLIAAAAIESVSVLRTALVFSDLHTVTTTGKEDARREKTTTKPVEECARWIRTWVLGPETGIDVLGRAAAVLLAHHLADERVMPPSQRPYHHERALPVQHVAAATPVEVDVSMVAHFKERNSYILSHIADDAGDQEGGES